MLYLDELSRHENYFELFAKEFIFGVVEKKKRILANITKVRRLL